MKISELIADVGDANIEFQTLDECAVGARQHSGGAHGSLKSGTHITFITTTVFASQMVEPSTCPKLGMVVWLPRQAVDLVMQQEEDRVRLTHTTATAENAGRVMQLLLEAFIEVAGAFPQAEVDSDQALVVRTYLPKVKA